MLAIIKKIDKFKAECRCTQCSKHYIVNSIYDAKNSHCGDLCNSCKNIINNAPVITQSLLKNVLSYDPLTGEVRYKVNTKRKRIGELVGHKHNSGYLEVNFGKNKRMLLHRLIVLYQTGILPDQVDHINHNKLDNRWSNLRCVNNHINSKNCTISKNSNSKINGVNYMPTLQKYRAYITVNHKQIHLGVFKNIQDAVEARHKADKKYGFHKNHGK